VDSATPPSSVFRPRRFSEQKPKKRSFAAMMASRQRHSVTTPPATPASFSKGYSNNNNNNTNSMVDDSQLRMDLPSMGKASPQTVGSTTSSSHFVQSSVYDSTSENESLLSVSRSTSNPYNETIQPHNEQYRSSVFLNASASQGTAVVSSQSPLDSATSSSQDDTFPLSPESLTTPTSGGNGTMSGVFSPVSSGTSMTTPSSSERRNSDMFSPQFVPETPMSMYTTSTTNDSSFISPVTARTPSSDMSTPSIVTPTRPRSKSKRKLQRLVKNLSIVVPPSEQQSEEFRQGSLVITKEGIKHFEASPLDPAGSAKKQWNNQQLASTPSSLSTHRSANPGPIKGDNKNGQEDEEDKPAKSKKVALFNKHGIQCDNSIQLKDLRYVRELGRGASSVVSLMEHRPSKKLYAMKTLILDSERISPSMIYDEIEALVLAKDSSYIVNLVQAFYDKKQIHLLLEYIDGNSLEQLLMRRKQLPEYVLSLITSQLLVALQFLHPKIMHMDIKPANILISASGRVYIADFGTMVKQKRLQDPDSIQRYSELGTVLFWPPERAQNMPFDYRSDIWNLGITLFVLRVGNLPFSYTNATTHFQIRDAIERLDIEEILKQHSHLISPQFADFLEKCLQKDPSKRATAEELVSHPFISNYKSVWTQNAGEDRVSNYLSIDEFHIDPSEKAHAKKDHTPDENVTRIEEIIQRATQQSRDNSPTDAVKSPELFSPSSSTPPTNTDIYFEVYNDSTKQEKLEYEPESFNSRSKKKFYNRKAHHHSGGGGYHHSHGYHQHNHSSGSIREAGQHSDKFKSPPSQEKSWKHGGFDKARSKSMHVSASSSRRMASMDFDFDDVFQMDSLEEEPISASERSEPEPTSQHGDSSMEGMHTPRKRSSSMSRGHSHYRSHENYQKGGARLHSSSSSSRITPISSGSPRVVSSSYDDDSTSGSWHGETPPRILGSSYQKRRVTISPQLEHAQEYVNTYLPSGDLYTKKRQHKFQRIVKKMSKSDQEKIAVYVKQCEDKISAESPSSWKAEAAMLHSPTFSRSFGSPRDSKYSLKGSLR